MTCPILWLPDQFIKNRPGANHRYAGTRLQQTIRGHLSSLLQAGDKTTWVALELSQQHTTTTPHLFRLLALLPPIASALLNLPVDPNRLIYMLSSRNKPYVASHTRLALKLSLCRILLAAH